MKRVVAALNPKLDGFEASCFDGVYIAGDVERRRVRGDGGAARKASGDEDEAPPTARA